MPNGVVHLIEAHGKFSCCGRTPFEVPMRDAMTTNEKEATCPGQAQKAS